MAKATIPSTDRTMRSGRSVRILVIAVTLAAAACLAVPSADGATIISLSDLNSQVNIAVDAQGGMGNWTVDGVNNLSQQWFWYRVGNAAEQSIDSLPVSYSSTANTLNATYAGTGFAIDIAYHLFGSTPGSLTANLTETIRIRNLWAAPLDFHFFQYSDFDLLGTPGDDAVGIAGVVARQTDPTLSMSETSAIRQPDHAEVGLVGSILGKLNDSLPTDLSDNYLAGSLGPGNVTWAFQWDQSIAAGGSFFISKDKQLTLVPEPATLALLVLGGVGFAGRLARRRRH